MSFLHINCQNLQTPTLLTCYQNICGETSGTQIKIRYNANDKLKTSDIDDGSTSAVALNTNATFTIKPYLSQYLSVLFDETATTPQKYVAGQEDPVVVNPPESIGSQIDAGYALSQQLIYIRGP